MEQLKPCPFCGEEPMLSHDHIMSYVECVNPMCDVQPWTKYTYTDEEAIEAWNRRVDNG